jgi:predicted MPP superfamily phosphohydrolase
MKKKRFVLWGIVAIIIGLGIYGVLIEPYKVEVRHFRIQDSGLGKVLEGLTAIHISDLHIRKIGKREQKILRVVEELQPDFIFLTGDYVKWDGDYEAALFFLAKLRAKIGVWAVMGGYDYSCSRKSCFFCHEPGSGKAAQGHSIRFLRNTLEKVNIEDCSIWIGGIDLEEKQDLFSRDGFQIWKGKEPAIVLSHSPLSFELLDKNQDVLILSGDTHGGQIPLPSWLWRILGNEECARYSQGFFRKGCKKMFVTRGVGTSHLPIRIFRSPEVVVFHF